MFKIKKFISIIYAIPFAFLYSLINVGIYPDIIESLSFTDQMVKTFEFPLFIIATGPLALTGLITFYSLCLLPTVLTLFIALLCRLTFKNQFVAETHKSRYPLVLGIIFYGVELLFLNILWDLYPLSKPSSIFYFNFLIAIFSFFTGVITSYILFRVDKTRANNLINKPFFPKTNLNRIIVLFLIPLVWTIFGDSLGKILGCGNVITCQDSTSFTIRSIMIIGSFTSISWIVCVIWLPILIFKRLKNKK